MDTTDWLGVFFVAVVVAYVVAVLLLKREIRRIDRKLSPVILQLRDLRAVRRARSMAASTADRKRYDRLLVAVYLTMGIIPFGWLLAIVWILL